MICIVDYGAGNLRSVQKALERLGGRAQVTASAEDILAADKVILPGVGAFGKAVEALDRLQLRQPILRIIEKQKPFLGICLGMQLLLESSEENPHAGGLAAIPGKVLRFSSDLKVPHLGWNSVHQSGYCALWHNIPEQAYFYFAHSYYASPLDNAVIVGTTDYGQTVPVALHKDNLFGLQFHPEKSQKIGLALLQNFLRL